MVVEERRSSFQSNNKGGGAVRAAISCIGLCLVFLQEQDLMANAGLNQCMVREQLLLLTSPVYWTEGSSLLRSTAAFCSVFIIFSVYVTNFFFFSYSLSLFYRSSRGGREVCLNVFACVPESAEWSADFRRARRRGVGGGLIIFL